MCAPAFTSMAPEPALVGFVLGMLQARPDAGVTGHPAWRQVRQPQCVVPIACKRNLAASFTKRQRLPHNPQQPRKPTLQPARPTGIVQQGMLATCRLPTFCVLCCCRQGAGRGLWLWLPGCLCRHAGGQAGQCGGCGHQACSHQAQRRQHRPPEGQQQQVSAAVGLLRRAAAASDARVAWLDARVRLCFTGTCATGSHSLEKMPIVSRCPDACDGVAGCCSYASASCPITLLQHNVFIPSAKLKGKYNKVRPRNVCMGPTTVNTAARCLSPRLPSVMLQARAFRS